MQQEEIRYDRRLKHQWRAGELARQWRREYPSLFDDEDLRIALTQPSYHFVEWLGALHYYRQGYNVLVEQYIYEAHPRKLSVLRQIIGERGIRFLKLLNAQPPDLFVYTSDERSFFFAEVKSERDRLSKRQEDMLLKLEHHFGREARLLRVIGE